MILKYGIIGMKSYLFVGFIIIFFYILCASCEDVKLEPGMPNVCVVERRRVRRVKRSVMVPKVTVEKFWKANCRFKGDWCRVDRNVTVMVPNEKESMQMSPSVSVECCKGFVTLKGFQGCLPKSTCDARITVFCKNGALCYQEGYHAKCACPVGFIGIFCDNDVNECDENNGGCEKECCNLEGGHSCKCPPGFKLSEDSKKCEDIDECVTANISGCSHACTNLPGGFRCECPSEMQLGPDRLSCVPAHRHPCDSPDNGGCQQRCERLSEIRFLCACDTGYRLNSDRQTCSESDGCSTNNGGCSQLCVHESANRGQVSCGCRPGFKVDSTKKSNCIDIDECATDNGRCQQSCKNVEGSFVCDCFPGWLLGQDERSCYKVKMQLTDPCKYGNGGCAHSCTSTSQIDGGILKTCSCNKGYRLEIDGMTCSDEDECASGVHECQPPAMCLNELSTYSCICPAGYRIHDDQKSCMDINECFNYNGGCEQICVNTEGSYQCSCRMGENLAANRRSCTKPPATNKETSPQKDTANCAPGTFGDQCVFKCYHCMNGATCNDHQTGCSCLSGNAGVICEIDCIRDPSHPECPSRPIVVPSVTPAAPSTVGSCACLNGGSCVSSNSGGPSQCRCLPGFSGPQCKLTRGCRHGQYGDRCQLECGAACGPMGGACHRLTGQCLCRPGRYGSRCHLHCPARTWGAGCSHLCRCFQTNNDGCHPETGECLCKKGYRGRACLSSCEPGYHGHNCAEKCPSQCRGTDKGGMCDPESGRCITLPNPDRNRPGLDCGGTDSGRPECQKDCPDGSQCQTQCNCSINTASCENGICRCAVGYVGKRCETECPLGLYGDGCSQMCRCDKTSICDYASGICHCTNLTRKCRACPPGKWGLMCELTCDCDRSSVCDQITGHCQCLPGYQGGRCEKECTSGYYGNGCSQRCSCVKAHHSQCDPVTGQCFCLAGWRGETCDTACEPGFYGDRCRHRCRCEGGAVCDPADGSCLCPSGRRGITCERACPEWSHGPSCIAQCSCSRDHTRYCDPETGACICRVGWRGASCSQKCRRGSYGDRCMNVCQCLLGAPCDPETGHCLCPVGRHGDACELECGPGRYGTNCSQACTCRPMEQCDPATGQCSCPSLAYGRSCEKQEVCRSRDNLNCGTNQCSCPAGSECEPRNGRCRCRVGLRPPQCRSMCRFGWWGRDCSEQCRCQNGEPCYPLTGQCMCLAGYTGAHCTETCQEGRHGPDCALACPDRCAPASCHPQTGHCVCRPGLIDTGTGCEARCSSGRYGPSCLQNCQCRNGAACDPETGSCRCTSGFYGALCELACPANFYGPSCRQQCGLCYNRASCHPETGRCLCPANFGGLLCEKNLPLIKRYLLL